MIEYNIVFYSKSFFKAVSFVCSLKSISTVFERKNIETVEVLLRYCPELPLHHYPGISEIFRLVKIYSRNVV
jgi:hypothetical protein